MKKITKILFVIAIMFIANLTIGVSAKEINIESEEIWGKTTYTNYPEYTTFALPDNNQIMPLGTSAPSTTWSWSNGRAPFGGSTTNTVIYSNYLYTGTTMLRFYITKADVAFTAEVYSKDTGLFWADEKVATINIERITAEQLGNLTRVYTLSGLSASTKYYVKVLPAAYFDGTIGNS